MINPKQSEFKPQKTKQVGARTKSKKALSTIVVSARRLALALIIKCVFKFVTVLNFPNGGSISLIMAPLVLTSLYCGPIWGTRIGLAYGVCDRLIDGAVAYHWLSLILDYFLGFARMGVASIFRKQFFEKKTWSLVAGRTLAGFSRFICSFFSGLFISWDDVSTGALNPNLNKGGLIYSLGYNLGYMVPSILICTLLLVAISKPLFETRKLPIVLPLIPESAKHNNAEVGTSVRFSVETAFTFVRIICVALNVVALIPPCGESLKGWNFWTGYFWLSGISLIVVFARILYAFYQFVYGTHKDEFYCGYFKVKRTYKQFYRYRIAVSVIVLVRAIVAIVGRYTFYKPIYEPVEA